MSPEALTGLGDGGIEIYEGLCIVDGFANPFRLAVLFE